MADFRPFNLGQAMSAGQDLAFNRYRLGETQRGIQARSAQEEAMRTGDDTNFKQQFPIEAEQYGDIRADRRFKQLEQDRVRLEDMHSLLISVKDQPSLDMALQAAQSRNYDVSKTPKVFGPEFLQYQQMAATDILGVKGTLEMQLKEAEKLRAERKLDIEEKKLDLLSKGIGSKEYIVPVNTAEGVMGFDTRRGRYVDPSTGETVNKPLIRSQDDPTLQGELRGTIKQSEEAGKLYNEAVENSLKISDQIEVAKEGITKLLDYTKGSIGGTGPFATVGGLKRLTSAELQDLEANFNKINLKNLVTTFQGFSRSIDTAVERGAWDRTQPNIKLDDPVNLNILIGNVSLGVKAMAEADARRAYIESSTKKNLEGYVSPIIGKTKTMFNQNGESQMVTKEQVPQAEQQGWMDADQYAEFLKSGSGKSQSTGGIKFLGFE